MTRCEQILKKTAPQYHSKHRGQVLKNQSKNFQRLNKNTRPRRNYDWIGNTIQKTIRWKIKKKTAKINVKMPQVNKKTTSEKTIFVQTPFWHSTLNLEQKKFTPQNHSLFRSTSCFGVTKITTPIWLHGIMEMCEQILKKDSVPIQFKFFEL